MLAQAFFLFLKKLYICVGFKNPFTEVLLVAKLVTAETVLFLTVSGSTDWLTGAKDGFLSAMNRLYVMALLCLHGFALFLKLMFVSIVCF